jgi:hypothetical protein
LSGGVVTIGCPNERKALTVRSKKPADLFIIFTVIGDKNNELAGFPTITELFLCKINFIHLGGPKG